MIGVQHVDTLIVGAGQAGLSLSRHLGDAGHEHVVLDRGRIGERWRSERWDSLSLLTPNWLNRLPGSAAHADPDGFLSGRAFAGYLEDYAASFAAPVEERTAVRDIRATRSGGYRVTTSTGRWRARRVVIATGDSAEPAVPALAAGAPAGLRSLHAARYRRPDALPPGAVLVVGAGPSGQQIAAELRRAGRDVVLAVGRHARVPRRYRELDIFTWLSDTGRLDQTLDQVRDEGAARRGLSLPLSGARGGEQLDLGVLAQLGVVVAGRLEGFDGRRALLAGDLPATTAATDAAMRRLLARLDAHAEATGLACGSPDAPPPLRLPAAPTVVDLAGFGAIVWATGYRRVYPWLRVGVLDARGDVVQRRGRTAAAGLHTLGMKFQWRRKSHYIGGVGSDAADLAAEIAGA